MSKEAEAARAIASTFIGRDVEVVIVGSKTYPILPPTVKRLAGAIHAMSYVKMSDAPTLYEMMMSNQDAEAYSRALSWLIRGDESLADELAEAPISDVIDALQVGIDMTGQSFMKAVGLLKSVRKLAARANP